MKKFIFIMGALFAIGQLVYPLVKEYIDKYRAEFPPQEDFDDESQNSEDDYAPGVVAVQAATSAGGSFQPVAGSGDIQQNEAF